MIICYETVVSSRENMKYHKLLSVISDGVVNVHDLTVFAPITSLEKARGATMFVLDLQVNT